MLPSMSTLKGAFHAFLNYDFFISVLSTIADCVNKCMFLQQLKEHRPLSHVSCLDIFVRFFSDNNRLPDTFVYYSSYNRHL